MLGGQSLLDGDFSESDDPINGYDKQIQTKVLSLSQDLVYNVSGVKHWTPNHVGLGCSLWKS